MSRQASEGLEQIRKGLVEITKELPRKLAPYLKTAHDYRKAADAMDAVLDASEKIRVLKMHIGERERKNVDLTKGMF